MKNFLQVNRALVAKKKHLLFNQSFGMVGSPNQTGETLTRENRIGLMSYLRRTLMLLFAVLVMSIANIGMAWGANGDVLFSQNFNSATAVDYAVSTARAYTSSNYNICGTTAASQFTTITCNSKGSAGIGINSATGGNSKSYSGKFGVYANNTGFYWSICKTSNFAGTAPTAIKVEFNAAFSYVSSGSNTGVQIAVGSGFSSGLTNSCPALSNCVAGFAWPSNSAIRIAKYAASNGNTAINGSSATLTAGTSYKYTWVINNTSETLTYTGPDNKSTTVAAGCWDLWVGTTRNLAGVTKATTGMSGTTIQNLYIGSPFGKKHEFIFDDITVTDLTPASCTNPTASWSTAPANGTAGGNMNASLTTNYAAGVVYTSSNTDVATVSGDGTATCAINYVAAGTARITATVTGDGSTICAGPATCYTDITVSAAGSPWTIRSNYTDNNWSTNRVTMTGTTTVTGTWNITTAGLYEFKVVDTSSDTWYGNTGNIGCNVSGWTFSTGESANCKFFASETGNYTFTFNTSTKALSVTYPTAQGKYYYKNTGSWGTVAVYRYVGGINNGWPGTQVVETETICGDTYYFTYADPGTTLIFNNNGGGSQTGNMAASGNAGKYVQGTESSWRTFPTYTVTYNKNGDGAGGAGSVTGSVPTDSNSPYACGSTVTVLGNTGSLAKDGYNFIGWNTAANGSGAGYTAGNTFSISANTTLYAQWELIPTYDITYNANEGTGTTASQTGNLSGAVVATRANGFTRSGYKFKWWNTAANGSGEDFYPGEKVTIASADVNLYAQWEQVAANQEFWTPIDEASKVTGVAISKTAGDMSITSGGATDAADINVDVNASAAVVNKYNSSVEKHAKVLALKANDNYIEIHFTDGSPINKLWLGATPANADSKNIVVVYSATSNFTTAGGAAHEFKKVGSTDNLVALPGNTQATKSVTDVSPSTENTYYYARIYRRITTANTVFDNTTNLGSGTTVRIYSIKAQKGVSCVAPATVNVTATVNEVSGYWFYPGDDVVLTAAPTGSPAGSPVTYQWKKNGSNVGTNSATLTINDAAASDAGKYTCTISYGECSTTSAEFSLKCMQFYLKNSSGEDISNHALQKVDATHATLALSLTGGTTYNFRVTDGCNDWYGNSDATGMTSSNCTNWTMPHDADCKVTTSSKSATYTFNFDFSAGLLGSEMKVSVVYPAGDQAAGKVIYWDNNVLNWASAPWYRIGKGTHNNKTQMTLVPGTAKLYKVTTAEYNGFEYWHIANNEGEGTGNIFWTKDSDPTTNEEITNAMGFEGSPVTADAITVTPTAGSHGTGTSSDNDNCEFYEYGQQNGMKTDRVTISDYSGGTITVNYTNTSGSAATLTSGYADLAHSVILTSITAVANTGYDAGAITINGNAYAANYVVTGATTIAASFTLKQTTITINANTANHGSTTPGSVTATYGSALPSFTAATGASGWNLTGYFTAPTSGTKVINADGTLVASTDYADGSGNWKYETATLTLYPQYEEEGCTPTTASITFNNNVAGKYNTAWVAGDITTSGGATYSLTNCSVDSDHPMTKPAIKGAKNKTLIQINIPAGATSGTISVSAATYSGGGATLAITNSGGSVLTSQSLASTTTNADAVSWSAPTLNTASYNITSGGTYYIKETSNSNNIYIYAFSATAEVPCDETAPTFVSSVPANGATGVATSGTIVLTFSEALGSVDASKFTLTGATKGAVSIDGTDATKVNIAYSGAANEATVTLATAAAAVSDLAGNALAAALSNISFTTAAAEPDPLVSWTMNLNTATWGAASTSNHGHTEISSIATSRTDGGTGSSGSATAKVKMASAEVSDASNPSDYAAFTFTINAAKKVEPDRVTCEVFNVSTGNRTYKAQISDSNGHVYNSTNTVAVSTEATLTPATFTFASDLVLTGNVTVKVYAWKTSGSPTDFRMGADVKLFGEVQNAADYTVTHTMSNVTKSAGATSVKEGNNYTATYAGAGGYVLPSTITVTIGGSSATAGTDYTWTQGTGVVSIPGNKVTGNIVITVTGVAPAPTYSVTHSLTNVTATSGATGAGAATEGVAYNAVFAANSGYVLPSTITVTIGGSPATVGTGYTWNASTGAFQVPAAQVTGAIVITIAGETAPATKDIYYGAITITAGALTKGSTGTSQFFTNIGGTIANNTEISWSSGPGTGGEYYESNVLTDTELSKSSNWNTSSGSNRYVGGMKFQSGSTYTLALGSKVASSITFYGRNGSASKTMTVGGEDWTSSSTKNTFAKHEFIKTGGFTGNVTITEDGDFYGILVITIQTATPCTTPIIPTLSNQTVCPGNDIAAWDATQTAVLADGETASYSWKKKGNDTELANTASFDLGSSAAESQAGTYVVTVTVSKAGKASATATKEVTLTVTPATETPSVSANKATIYAGNSVTLTATCGSSGTITWAWYTCNSDGTGESAIGGATSNSYAIASAPAAGTYYYKVKATGDGTNACGTASHIYTLTVSEASGTCNMMTIFDGSTMSSAPASTSGTESTSGATWTAVGTATEMSSTVSMEYSGKTYTKGWKFTGGATTSSSRYIQIVIPTGYTGDLVMNGFIGSTSRSVFVATSPTGTLNTSIAYWSPATTNTLATATTRLSAGTYYVCATNSAFLTELSVNVCGDEVCTDEKPTATATNNTVCSGSTLTITATGYESDPTSIQWQKKNGESWDNISGATSATYSVASAAAADAGTYRVQVTKGCTRNSNEVTITVPSAPVFGDVPSSVTIMQTIALSISTVEASDAASYKWYKSADATWDAGDAEIGSSKNLIKAYADEAIGSPSYHVFCRATNSCGTVTSSAIAVNVTAYVAEDCAERGGEEEAQFGFENTSMSSGSYNNETAWSGNSNSKYLTYIAPTGKNFATAKVTIATSGGSNAAYAVYNGSSWTYYNITGMSSSWQEKSIDLPANTTKFQIGRRLDDKGTSSGTFCLHEACFTYTETCTATTITVSGTGSETHTIGDSFTEPKFTVRHGGTAFDPQPEITYTSSNEDIATVDDNGTVNFQGMAGTVTITAAYAGDATYCASEGHYTITVSCSDDEPKIVAASTVNLSGCNSSVVLDAKKQDETAFAGGTYQWYRDGEAISGATSASYTAVQAGVYTVERTNSGCTNLSSNSATVTSETVEPEIEHLAPFQYYHVDKTYSAQMKMRHLFTVKGSAAYGSTGKNFKMELSKNSAAATDVTTSNAFVVWQSADKTVDTVMIDLNKLYGKYAENDELVLTCKAVDCEGNVSTIYKDEITIHVIGSTPTMALILNGKDSKVGGDFLEDYEPKNLQEQTGSKTWSGEWPMYTDLKTAYNVTPVNGYAPFNKLNYEPFDIIFLTDFPKASKSDATKALLDDMSELVDFRPMFSFKTHMLWINPSKWAAKGFTTEPVVPKGGDGRTSMNIVCYAHPMFKDIKTGDDVYSDASDASQLVYKLLTDVGYENSKGMQGFEIEAAENFVTIGLIHNNAGATPDSPTDGEISWSPNSGDRMLVAACERQANPEARMILFSLNAGAHSKLTEKGRLVVMESLEYLIQTSGGLIEPADCSYTFDNAAGDNNWNTAGNWGPRHNAVPGAFTSARIAAPAVVDIAHAVAMEVRIVEGGSITIPAGKGLEVKSTIRHMDGSEISPTEISELTLEASSSSNGTLIFNNNTGDTKATVWAYSKGFISGGVKNYQYIGTPFNELNALYNYYGSWIYSWGVKKNGNWGWVAVKNGGPMNAWTGYCISQESPTYYETSGTMTATGTVDIAVPAGENMVIGNSWTAPIDINALTTDDLDGLVANIYFFNTGVDKEGTAGAAGSRYAGGTYVTVPVEAARYEGEDDHINSMQGFFVKNTSGSDGALHLDYDRHVRGTTRGSIIGDALHAPARRAALDSNEPEVLKIKVSGENYDDKLLLLAREDFSIGFDNGWDGDKWDGNESSLYIYTTDEEGTENSVSAIPQLEGTVIGFRAGEDDAYTLNFEYLNSDEPLYLYDVENNTYTQIMTGMTYRFFTTDNEKHARFIITRSNGQEVATGVESTSGSLDRSKAKKLLIEDKMFIIVNGMLYDATGKVVK